MIVSIRVCLLASFGTGLVCAQQPPAAAKTAPMTAADVRAMASALVEGHMGWGPELNSAGASLAVREASRDGGTVTFGLRQTGLPKDKVYVLYHWPVTQLKPVPALTGVTFDDNGVAICAGRPGTCGKADKPNDPVELTAVPAPGEPFRFAVAAVDDPAIKAYVKVVPVPVEAEDKGCRLRGVVLLPRGTLLAIEATGFPASSVIGFHTESEGEIHDTKPTTDAAGRYLSAVLPVKAGVERGTVKIRAVAGECKPEISFPWSSAR